MAELGCKPLRLRWRFGTILTSILSPRSYGHYERVRGLLTALPRPTPCRWCVRRKQSLPWNRPFGYKSEHARVRGEAAEALAHCHRKESHDVLLAGLLDPSKEVRFWCAFALGEMGNRQAIPTLKRIVATDKRIVKGWYSVAKEAADAVRNIEKGRKSYRGEGRCGFCFRGQ